MNAFKSCSTVLAAMATANRTAVNTTRKSEMPSTPTFHEMPKSLIHGCCETSWNPATPVRNRCRSTPHSATSSTAASSASARTISGRERGTTAMTTAAATGSTTIAVKTGNAVMVLPWWP